MLVRTVEKLTERPAQCTRSKLLRGQYRWRGLEQSKEKKSTSSLRDSDRALNPPGSSPQIEHPEGPKQNLRRYAPNSVRIHPESLFEMDRNRCSNSPECADWSVAVLLDELTQLGIDDNTLVVFTSDNGGATQHGSSNAPLRGRKGQTWEGGIRVPCVMRWPGGIPAGTECREVATAMDFLPTFAALAGGEAPTDRRIDGRDISGFLRGEEVESSYEAFFYYREMELQAVRAGDWKLHLQTGELYNLRKDVGEGCDVAQSHPDVVAALEGHAARCREDLGDSLTGIAGANRRPCGRVEDPKPLTVYRDDHPYIVALYD